MFLIELGYYEDEVFGICIENFVIVKEVKMEYLFGDKLYFGFEYVIMVLYVCNFIDEIFFILDEKDWLNWVNKKIFEKMFGYFENDFLIKVWLLWEM